MSASSIFFPMPDSMGGELSASFSLWPTVPALDFLPVDFSGVALCASSPCDAPTPPSRPPERLLVFLVV